MRRDQQGHTLTFITCTSPTIPDGLVIADERLVEDDNPRVAQCSHKFAIPEYGVLLIVDYPRVLMRDWARLEARYRKRLAEFHIGTEDEE